LIRQRRHYELKAFIFAITPFSPLAIFITHDTLMPPLPNTPLITPAFDYFEAMP